MNLPRRRVVVFFAVLLFVAVGILVSTTQGTNTQLGQAQEGIQDGASTGTVPVSVALVPGLATAGIAVLAILAADRRERERLRHERQLKREALEDQRQSRLRDERIRVYTDFGSRWTLYEGARRSGGPREKYEAHTEFMRSFNALSLLAPEEVRAAAAEVLNRASQGKQQDKAPGLFWKAAREDLGIPD